MYINLWCPFDANQRRSLRTFEGYALAIKLLSIVSEFKSSLLIDLLLSKVRI